MTLGPDFVPDLPDLSNHFAPISYSYSLLCLTLHKMVRQGRQQKTEPPELPHKERQSSVHIPIDAESNSASIAPDLNIITPASRPSRPTKGAVRCLPTPVIARTAQAPP